MIIRDFAIRVTSGARITSATIAWEDRNYPEQVLFFEIQNGSDDNALDTDEPCADSFLAGCFPLAAVHGESRVRIDGWPCPMLVEGLYAAHAWWSSWGGMPTAAPNIETFSRGRSPNVAGFRRAVAFLSGGVDSLHMLMRNRHLYRQGDPAYIRDALFIHGFDIGKRARDPETERFQMALRGIQPIAAEAGLRVIACRTNLRHLPSLPDFWEHRHNGAALAAVAHAATVGSAFVFIGGSFPIVDPVPWGSHPAVDGLFSSQRITLVHDGSRFSRLRKVQDLLSWPTALSALRVCPVAAGPRANCGECEKCLRTRLELLAAGIEETETFGPSLPPSELWDKAAAGAIGERAIFYEDLIEPLRARGLDALCHLLERKVTVYREQPDRRAVAGHLTRMGESVGEDMLAGRPGSAHYS
jgi:hypothetical protein